MGQQSMWAGFTYIYYLHKPGSHKPSGMEHHDDLAHRGQKRGQATFPVLCPLHGAPCDGSCRHDAAVHRQDTTGRPARLIRGEIDRRLRDLLRLAKSTQRM